MISTIVYVGIGFVAACFFSVYAYSKFKKTATTVVADVTNVEQKVVTEAKTTPE